MCIVILSHNNIEHDRYKKIMDTVLMQLYKNYHIVFIDDCSSDENFEASKDYLLNELKFPEERTAFIRNERRMFATYNIKNAAFNYCKPEEIYILIDGDD